MNKFTLLLIAGLAACTTARPQLCNSTRFTEVNFFSRDDIGFETGIFAQARNIKNQTEALRYNVWFPKPGRDPLPKRPFVLMVHGGGFVGGQRQDLDTICLMLARRGFVAATIDYRLGYDTRCRDSLSRVYAVCRAIQDAHAAMRFFVSNEARLRLDTTKLLAGGGSAGAATALNLNYATQDEVDLLFPGVRDSLGRIDTSGNTLRNPFRIKGIFNNWGGLLSDFYDAAEAVPTISFHGEKDTTVPIDSSFGVQCLLRPFVTYGSRGLHRKMRITAPAVCTNLTVAINGGHGIFNDTNAEKEFRVSKAACFFKSVFCGTCTSFSTTDTIPANCAPPLTAAASASPGTNGLRLQPNPVSNVLFINGITDIATAELKVYDLTGGLRIATKAVNRIDVQALPPGSYLLRISSDGKIQQTRFVKQ